MKLYKDGLTMTFTTPMEIAYYKGLGYTEVNEGEITAEAVEEIPVEVVEEVKKK